MRVMYKSIKNKQGRKGFSLSEVLLSVALMAIVGTAAIGGLVVLNRARNTIDKQTKAEMIMIATVNYLRTDLNDCQNPSNMNCATKGSLYFTYKTRYGELIIRNNKNQTALVTGVNPKAMYWNSTPETPTKFDKDRILYGIAVQIDVQYTGQPNGWGIPNKNRKYLIAQNVMEGTGMYSMIGGNGMINYDPDNYLFYFTVDVVDAESGDIVLSQYVEVCPDKYLPSTTNNP